MHYVELELARQYSVERSRTLIYDADRAALAVVRVPHFRQGCAPAGAHDLPAQPGGGAAGSSAADLRSAFSHALHERPT